MERELERAYRLISERGRTWTILVGTPRYVSPSMLSREEQADPDRRREKEFCKTAQEWLEPYGFANAASGDDFYYFPELQDAPYLAVGTSIRVVDYEALNAPEDEKRFLHLRIRSIDYQLADKQMLLSVEVEEIGTIDY